ncbi:MAG TPA: aspartate aminotransferase family protein [Myxococcaceae bacterium]|nr:aspartate aminotransferase family protein [Myxococcaceae bacterium]
MDSKTVRAKHREYLLPAVANYYEEPLVPWEGKGARLKDLDGRTYLDCFGGILTISVGHANERVTAAITQQVQRLTHLSTLYPTVPMVELAERLVRVAPGALKKAFFTASGSEANEMAVNLAQTHTGHLEIIALRYGYSGRTAMAQSLGGNASYRSIPAQIGTVRHALSPYCYRCPLKLEPSSCGVQCARDIEELIRTTTAGRVAGMLVEPIQGLGGFITPPREYLEIAAEIVRKHGGVMIIDEVQTGFGRTGKMWGSQQYGVEPEILTAAKGIANGLPLGATLCTAGIGDSFRAATISTFGGNPVSCAAAVAVLDEIEEKQLAENAARRGQELRAGLERLQRSNRRTIGEVRGMGLMQGLELVQDETTGDRTPNVTAVAQVFEETRKRGLLVGRGGLYGNVLRLAPPLTITAAEVEEALRILEESFAAIRAE